MPINHERRLKLSLLSRHGSRLARTSKKINVKMNAFNFLKGILFEGKFTEGRKLTARDVIQELEKGNRDIVIWEKAMSQYLEVLGFGRIENRQELEKALGQCVLEMQEDLKKK